MTTGGTPFSEPPIFLGKFRRPHVATRLERCLGIIPIEWWSVEFTQLFVCWKLSQPLLCWKLHHVGSCWVSRAGSKHTCDIHHPWHLSYDHKILSLANTGLLPGKSYRNLLHKSMGKILVPFHFPLTQSIRSVGNSKIVASWGSCFSFSWPIATCTTRPVRCHVLKCQADSHHIPLRRTFFLGACEVPSKFEPVGPACEPGEGGKPAVGPAAIWSIGQST